MKTLLMIALLSVSGAASAQAKTTICLTPFVADAGFNFQLDENRQEASLLEQSFRGGNRPLPLVCEAQIVPMVFGPMQTTLICRSEMVNGSFTAVHVLEGRAGRRAIVKKVTMIDGYESSYTPNFGQLKCLPN